MEVAKRKEDLGKDEEVGKVFGLKKVMAENTRLIFYCKKRKTGPKLFYVLLSSFFSDFLSLRFQRN